MIALKRGGNTIGVPFETVKSATFSPSGIRLAGRQAPWNIERPRSEDQNGFGPDGERRRRRGDLHLFGDGHRAGLGGAVFFTAVACCYAPRRHHPTTTAAAATSAGSAAAPRSGHFGQRRDKSLPLGDAGAKRT